MFTEKTKLASIEAIVKAPNYETIMNALQDVDDKVTPWVSMRIGVDTGMLSFETMTQQQYALKNYGWTSPSRLYIQTGPARISTGIRIILTLVPAVIWTWGMLLPSAPGSNCPR